MSSDKVTTTIDTRDHISVRLPAHYCATGLCRTDSPPRTLASLTPLGATGQDASSQKDETQAARNAMLMHVRAAFEWWRCDGRAQSNGNAIERPGQARAKLGFRSN